MHRASRSSSSPSSPPSHPWAPSYRFSSMRSTKSSIEQRHEDSAAKTMSDRSNSRMRLGLQPLTALRIARGHRLKIYLGNAILVIVFVVWTSSGSSSPDLAGADDPCHGSYVHYTATSLGDFQYYRCVSQGSQKRVDKLRNLPFHLSANPLPVHHVHERIHYHNTPVSSHRPSVNQFMLAPEVEHAGNLAKTAPALAIITATQNSREEMFETAKTVLGQSLQNIQWVIVDDHTTEVSSLAMLRKLAHDPRVVVLQNEGDRGLAASRNVALNWLMSENRCRAGLRPKYLASLDDDDLYELTALEKVVWMLESNPQWDLGGFQVIKFGATNETILQGVHSGAANFFSGNFVPNSAVYTSRAIANSGCRYDDVEFAIGGEDWDFWMCLATHGHWGGTVPEPLYWYRGNPAAFRASRWGNMFGVGGFTDLKRRIAKKHATLLESGKFPDHKPRPSIHLEPIRWDLPFDPYLARSEKSIMFVVPWLYIGGADIGALHQIQLFAEQGYRVTVVCTLYKNPQGLELRPAVLQYTHDVHVLPSFLRANDMPRYFKHLIESRGIEEVILSNSQLIYEMLPALTEQMPFVKFIDYLHNEAYDGWKSGGYPTLSIISQRYLSRTVTCSSYLRDWLIARGHEAASIGVVKLGIQVSDFTPSTSTQRTEAKRAILDIDSRTTVITVIGRLDPQKRPTLVPHIADTLRRVGNYRRGDFVILMLGDGALREKVLGRIHHFKVQNFVRLLGTIDQPADILAATDIFLLPTLGEGISIAVAEAMAMSLPVVTARVGALPEQLGAETANAPNAAGVLIEQSLDDNIDAPLYAYELDRLIRDPALGAEYGARGRKSVRTSFNWRQTLQGMFKEIEIAKGSTQKTFTGTPNPAAYFALQSVLLENHQESEFASGQKLLKMPGRKGVGRELQDRCGESSSSLTQWINAVASPVQCQRSGPGVIHIKKLQDSAKQQCGAWCIFDLSTLDHAGWSFNGNCFEPFSEEKQGWCRQFWSSRPASIRIGKGTAARGGKNTP